MRGEVGSSKFGGEALVNTRQEYEGGSQEKEKYLVKSCIILCPLKTTILMIREKRISLS